MQNPSVFGHLRDYTALAEACRAKSALLIVAVTEIVSLGAVMPPGAMDADIVVAEGQSIGNALSFGGPYVGLFAVREKYTRQMPGRLCGQTVDEDGRRGWVLTLSTREQHIRREKATSNVCTNAGLCALAFTIHLALLGEAGFMRLAALNHARAAQLADRLAALDGVEVVNDTFFNEFTVRLAKPAVGVVDTLAARGILAGGAGGAALSRPAGRGRLAAGDGDGVHDGRRHRGVVRRADGGPVMAGETVLGHRGLRLEESLIFDLDSAGASGVDLPEPPQVETRLGGVARHGPIGLPGLSEPEVVRHYTRLSQKNYAIDMGLYPLGSCTMKHNPRLNETVARLPGFAGVHPLQPPQTAAGALELIDTVAGWLKELTGMPGGGDVARCRRPR